MEIHFLRLCWQRIGKWNRTPGATITKGASKNEFKKDKSTQEKKEKRKEGNNKIIAGKMGLSVKLGSFGVSGLGLNFCVVFLLPFSLWVALGIGLGSLTACFFFFKVLFDFKGWNGFLGSCFHC